MPPKKPKPGAHAFTLTEVLVVIAVIAVLISILIPALRGAFSSARSTVCLANLRTIGATHAAWSGDHADAWLNLFLEEPDADQMAFAADNNSFYFPRYGEQCDIWLLGLLGSRPTADGYALDPGLSFEAYSCPVVFRDEVGLPGGEAHAAERPHLTPLFSYYYSPTLVTSADLWSEAGAPIDADLLQSRHRKLVRSGEVRFPSAKAAMAERADFHAKAITGAQEPETAKLNTLFADMHAARMRLSETTPPIPTVGFGLENFTSMVGLPGNPIRVPFRSTPGGYLGRDTSP